MNEGYQVTERIEGAHPYFDYPLLPGDLLTVEEGDTFMKEAPGLAVGGFTLTPEQVATLRKVDFQRLGLNYEVIP